MRPINIFKLSLLIVSPLALLGCAGDQYARQSSTDDLYFSRSDRKVKQAYREDYYTSPSAGYSEDYLSNRETDLDYGDEEYTARDVNPEYIAKYKKQGQENLDRQRETEEDVYFEEDFNQDGTYSSYTGGNSYSQPDFNRNNGAWQNNPYTFGPNRWNRPWNGFNSGWNFGLYSGWSNWGNSFGWNVGYNFGNPWGWNDPWMNPYGPWGWNDPWMNPYSAWGWNDPWMNPYYSRFGFGWGNPVFFRPYYPVRQVVVVRPAEPGVGGNVQVVNGYRGTRSNTIGVRNPDSRSNRRIVQEPASADNPNEDRIVTPDRYRYSRERTAESPRSREMNRSNSNRSNRTVSPSRNSNNNNTYQRSRSRSGSGSGSGTYQRSNSNNRSSGSGTYQRSRGSNSSSGGGGGSTFSSPSRSSSSGGSNYSPSRSRSSSGNSSSGGGSRSRSSRGGGGE